MPLPLWTKGVITVATLAVATSAWKPFEEKRLLNALRRRLLNPELEQSVISIQSVLNSLDEHLQGDSFQPKYPLLVNLLLLNTLHEREAAAWARRRHSTHHHAYHSDEDKARKRRLRDEAVCKDAARYVKFANSAYGLLLLKGLGILNKDAGWPPLSSLSPAQLDEWCILRHTGLERKDLILMSLGEQSRLHMPGHFLAVDHSTKSVVLAVRGTFSVKDAITDLVCDSVDFLDGTAHNGISQGAEFLLHHIADDASRLLRENKGYRIVITGHSLGGAVSILLAMLLNKQGRAHGINAPIHVFAFGPPPVFAPLSKVPTSLTKHIHSFVFRHDIVPRLSVTAAADLITSLNELDALPASLSQRFAYIVNEMRPTVTIEDNGSAASLKLSFRYSSKVNGQPHPFGNTGKIGTIEKHMQKRMQQDVFGEGGETASKSATENVGGHARLFVPGSIILMHKTVPTKDVEDSQYSFCQIGASDLTPMLVVDTCILDHMPSSYEEWFEGMGFQDVSTAP